VQKYITTTFVFFNYIFLLKCNQKHSYKKGGFLLVLKFNGLIKLCFKCIEQSQGYNYCVHIIGTHFSRLCTPWYGFFSIITSFRHVVIIGVVSYSSVVSIILFSKQVGELGFSMLMVVKLLVGINWSISLLETSTSGSYRSSFAS